MAYHISARKIYSRLTTVVALVLWLLSSHMAAAQSEVLTLSEAVASNQMQIEIEGRLPQEGKPSWGRWGWNR